MQSLDRNTRAGLANDAGRGDKASTRGSIARQGEKASSKGGSAPQGAFSPGNRTADGAPHAAEQHDRFSNRGSDRDASTGYGYDSEDASVFSTLASCAEKEKPDDPPKWLELVHLERVRIRDDAARELERLDQQANQLLSVPKMATLTTAAMKWSHARSVLLNSPLIEAWGAEGRVGVNGTYKYIPARGSPQGPPVFQQQEDPHKWLYVSMSGQWMVGGDESMDARRPQRQQGLARSAPVEPGLLPHLGEEWETCGKEGWAPSRTLHFWLTESVAVEWQRALVLASEGPVIKVQGANDRLDGLYDVVEAGTPGVPPVFQHQQRRTCWLYLASSQQWWFGDKYDKDAKKARGFIRSAFIQPGMHPCDDVRNWYAPSGPDDWKPLTSLKLTSAVGAIRAVDWWTHARKSAEPVELWGSEAHRNVYVPKPSEGSPSDAPVYQSQTDPEKWMFLGIDGRWWLGSTTSKDQRMTKGFIFSDTVVPGTLPQDVGVWQEQDCQNSPTVCVLLPQTVVARWKEAKAVASKSPVIKVQKVAGQDVNGLFDYCESETPPDGAPVYQHQVNQNLWMYVATDGCWWVSPLQYMKQRSPTGMVHSSPIAPGMLPTASEILWIVLETESKKWETQEDIRVN